MYHDHVTVKFLLVYSCMHFVDSIHIVFKVRPFAFFKGRFDMQLIEKITSMSTTVTVQILMGGFIVVQFYHFFKKSLIRELAYDCFSIIVFWLYFFFGLESCLESFENKINLERFEIVLFLRILLETLQSFCKSKKKRNKFPLRNPL